MKMRKFIQRHPSLRAALAAPRAIRRGWMTWRANPTEAVMERMSELLVGTVIFKAPEFDAVFTINARSHLLRDGIYEPRISGLFFTLLRPEGDIIDVGANVGFFTVGGAKRLMTGRVLAAEPTA